MKRVEQCADRWKKAYGQRGIVGLSDARKGASGRPIKRELSTDGVIARQEAKIRLLESQVELLKKVDMKESWLVIKGANLTPNKRFQLIKDAVDDGLGRMTRYLVKY